MVCSNTLCGVRAVQVVPLWSICLAGGMCKSPCLGLHWQRVSRQAVGAWGSDPLPPAEQTCH